MSIERPPDIHIPRRCELRACLIGQTNFSPTDPTDGGQSHADSSQGGDVSGVPKLRCTSRGITAERLPFARLSPPPKSLHLFSASSVSWSHGSG